MKNFLLSALFLIVFTGAAFPQANCNSPLQVTVCPPVYLANQSNLGMLDDAPSSCNYSGEDLVYEIHTPASAHRLYVSFVNLTGFTHLALLTGSCTAPVFSGMSIFSGNSNVFFNIIPGNSYFLFVDAPGTINYDISLGVDTPTSYVNIPNTQGNLQFDANCASSPFALNKPFFQVTYNGVFQTNPMTLSPLFTSGSLCVKIFFQNLTGSEGIKKFNFSFNPSGFNGISCPSILPGFYNSGNWIRSGTAGIISYTFNDSAGLGRGDFIGTPNSCLGYTFCFDVIPLSNNPLVTDVVVNAYSDGFGVGFSGWLYAGCCPLPNPNCHSVPSGGGAVNGFGFSFADPGNPLPIELKSFNTEVKDEKVQLNWVTASEINNEYFTIERSVDINQWSEIGRVKGAGNSTIEKHYSFTDEPTEGKWYYRLRQTDFDGNFTFSDSRDVFVQKADKVIVFPNPANGNFTITARQIKELQFYFYNLYGENTFLNPILQDGKAVINITDFKNGIYLLIVKRRGEIVKEEIVLIEN